MNKYLNEFNIGESGKILKVEDTLKIKLGINCVDCPF